MLESFTRIENMVKVFTRGQMEQNLKVTLRMTKRKDLEHLLFLVETNLRYVIQLFVMHCSKYDNKMIIILISFRGRVGI